MNTFDFSTKQPPKMPQSVANIPLIRHLLGKIPANMREAMTPSLFPHLAAHMSETAFLYTDNTYITLGTGLCLTRERLSPNRAGRHPQGGAKRNPTPGPSYKRTRLCKDEALQQGGSKSACES